ncbi:MAG: ATP-binding cassette domain-containing protein [Spirochaetaceae bacterium]|jgi:D-methionine transport system ATP-binding protein|nr:ATP-binding cassette domain-containing protein [Spirochaetaceae bacterium]
MITALTVSKKYGDLLAVNNLTLEIDEGGVYGIIGRSGAGKSTLLRLISLLEPPDLGEVRYAGKRVDALKGRDLLRMRRKMGMIFQNFNLFSSRDVFGNVAYPLEIAGLGKKAIKTRTEELLKMVNISDKKHSALRDLSGGQKQRVAIARALAVEPDVLFCDEATSALDPKTTREVLALIKELHEKLRITVVIVTHQMEVIRAICDKVAVMENGALAEEGAVEAVFTNPKSPAAKELLHGE